MRATFLFVLILTLIPISISSHACDAEELKSISLDDATKIGLRIEMDKNVKVEGKSSVKITTLWPTTICLGEVDGLDIENARLVYSARVKTDLQGTAMLEMWAHVGGSQYFSRNPKQAVKNQSNWKKVETPFMFQKGQKPEKVTLNLIIAGKGTVWIDDVKLSKE